jgi:cystathionine beta-lyase/cystathionine gamma-synthase
MSHASIPQTLRAQLAPPADLVRISVGLEDANDLMEDLDDALTSALNQNESVAD